MKDPVISPSGDAAAYVPTVTLPSMQTRRAACTHLTMKRFYGSHTCSICQRPSRLGWLYLCTQDESIYKSQEDVFSTAGSHIEREASINAHAASNVGVSEQPALKTPLSPWIEKAIQQGHYTPEQVVILRAQKQNVLDSIAAAEIYMENNRSNSPGGPSPLQSVASSTTDVKSFIPDPSTAEVHSIKEPEPSPVVKRPKPPVFPACRFQYCQICRPSYRDRSWMNLEDALSNENQPAAIDFEHDNRPISLHNVVCKLGLQEIRCPRTQNRGRRYLIPGTLTGRRTINPEDARFESERNRFRRGMMRAFRGMLMSRRRSSRSRSRSRVMKTRAKAKEEDATDCDMGLWKDLNEEILHLASSIRLPGHDGMDGLGVEEGVVEVEEGVAVTEEGVDLGTADIIMSL